ncbi:MAG: peptidoglycan DD-metalloendopeptidase family protein [Candidatus Marinimicrobia bacterium]|jgi:murein DD-endopeptidase MepM/ murein hydrolase activator NlpD|nr:peptidoglycan DD-metalloendopeptidase family protein [Candidatus Neomarinimicrobiota bacterium]MBT3675086.1 peptidoglycan DD-metalloendopeptidase family protein [Candidatus Neomarinimicrobiota bacterium]MBT3763909.1 peptidoglycan DD-metalloendopeptidase family protein [Candidatus Neomarinimicrobiota bacterium]MBT4067549.1 peptidoglycan DD-metalloendopeptidase family protein [Candidatus Neomarinimicrobiota bacterium]MBT4269920.1 peptidoglycan DD-metalloendopeptidase family protein [Candidatus
MFRHKKTNKYHNYIIVSERDSDVHQYNFSRQRLLTIAGIAVVFVSIGLFLSADALTGILYKAKLKDLRANYHQLTETLVTLQTQLEDVSGKMGTIEKKDQAIRTYAGLPQIDQDVRKMGVGGAVIRKTNVNDIAPEVTSRISEIEMNVETLSRKVKLELKSYNSLYNKVRDNSDNLKIIPSIRPVQEGYLGSGFGYREDPFTDKVRYHYGQDFAVNTGTKVYTPAQGKVRFAGNQGGYGKVIKIDHGNGYRTIYAHLSNIKVKRGQELKRGELIATSGNTGRSAGPHLHYEVHQYGAPQNPMDYFFSGHLK